ncbi:PREDICTED: uncharacterized protein LOC106314267 [Brassica oleracea var. oleracea]|uniref:uncharacterized protein LOC106314267 n=1 Tax=Brassica oleracea var. oleracea TaxID=109376 RepID=UPI0006A6BF24|nr:PREDICTED: uncharacterized protein LOC106314267 [Brassica oleracea var. oleracea]
MEVEFLKCLQIQEIDVTWTWHARLGHVNFGVMKNMVDKEMVVGMPQVIDEKDVCSTCLVGKQTRKSFPPKAKYRASHTLELVHENNDANQDQHVTSRYGHNIRKPKRFSDYILLAEVEGGRLLLTIDGEPESYIETAEIQAWIDAMKTEIESIIKTKTWKLVKKPTARLVVKGYVQQQGIDFDEVFAPVALRVWNIKLDRKEKGELLIIAIYVDDLFVTGTSLNVIKQFKDDMSRRFEMSDLGMLTYYLGIEVTQGANGIHIKQGGYAQGILVKTKMESSNYIHVLMRTSLKVSKAEEPEIDATSYRSTIGCLRVQERVMEKQ